MIIRFIFKLIFTIGVAILCLVGTYEFLMWLFPTHLYSNLMFVSLLAIDFALIISGIAPEGFVTIFKRFKK